jgi:hypothetical protein
VIKSLKRDPMGKSFSHLGVDGVFRVFHSESYEVIDAVRLSTAQIKEFLDRSYTFNQATEDKFRGVDGRGVPDKNMFNPPEEIRPKRPTEEEMQEIMRKIDEQKRNGVKKDPNAVCNLQKSNYNLDSI